MRPFLTAALLLCATAAQGQDAPTRQPAAIFPDPPGKTMVEHTFTYEPSVQTIRTEKSLITTRALTAKEKAYIEELAEVADTNFLYDVKLYGDKGPALSLFCDNGASEDPNCKFVKAGDFENAVEIAGLRFTIPGDGCVYASGHTNSDFSFRRKYCLVKDGLKEVVQPVLYVGVSSSALKPLTLKAGKDKGATITRIPAGGKLEVLVQDGEYYLIRDEFGLTGWSKINSSVFEPIDVKDIFYTGD
jgi:hypothetical protein